MHKFFLFFGMVITVACGEQKTEKKVIVAEAPKTTKAMNWPELAAWLPDIKGYQPGESTGENTHTGTSGSRYYAFARRQYKRDDKELVVEIIDYNDDPKTLNGLLNMYGFNTPVQNEQIQTRLLETGVPKIKALETKYSANKDIRLTLAVSNRFLIHISEPGGYDAKLPEQVMQSMLSIFSAAGI
jgi:hypothetical protein